MADSFYRKVCEAIRAQGFEYLENAKGSHEKWCNHDTGKLLIVPHNLKSRHTANSILKDSGSAERC